MGRLGPCLGVGKRYGAFRSAVEFITIFLEVSRNRCYYEVIASGKDRPCKSYLDVEVDAGAMTEEEGQAMCDAVIREWRRGDTHRWRTVREQCAQSLACMILKCSRLTGYGLKTSFHVTFLS
jgi:hypothetical protein